MQFEKNPAKWAGENDFISECGKFHIVEYPNSDRKAKWSAFFKPDGWPNFGNAVAKVNGRTAHFYSKGEAIEACEKFAEKFGDDFNQYNYIYAGV